MAENILTFGIMRSRKPSDVVRFCFDNGLMRIFVIVRSNAIGRPKGCVNEYW